MQAAERDEWTAAERAAVYREVSGNEQLRLLMDDPDVARMVSDVVRAGEGAIADVDAFAASAHPSEGVGRVLAIVRDIIQRSGERPSST